MTHRLSARLPTQHRSRDADAQRRAVIRSGPTRITPGVFVVADDTLPPRPGPQRTTSSYSQAAAGHRLTLLKFIALGVGIGATLLVGLILFSK